ncbi:Hypothetical predicted protein [Paramuricea clavata]|uniref:Uncharacterized protein n=1 Tax=Paramuricea clavata TaxID=317549 RepID=A0A6S7JUK9_PARCT|nr:Hypothetical predicted protein [Paramuricea clavata]
MEISHSSDDIHFRAPSEPAPRIEEGSKRQNTNTITRRDCRGKVKGGKMLGCGRRKVYEAGYLGVQSLLWKSISIHTNVHKEWHIKRKEQGFSNNTDFASFLLANIGENNHQAANMCLNNTCESFELCDEDEFNPSNPQLCTSTPKRARTALFNNSPHCCTEIPAKTTPDKRVTTEEIHENINISRQRDVQSSSEQVFLDTVVKENSLSESGYLLLDSDSETASDSDNDVFYTSSSSSEYEEDPNPVMDQFDISYDDDLFVHESETPDSQCNHDETCVEPIDMDITSELELGTIELDVAVNNHTRLIPENYYKDMEKDGKRFG